MSENKSDFSVKLSKIIEKFSLEELHAPENLEELEISVADLNRPGLQLAGFYEFFDNDRIQIFGRNEISFLRELGEQNYAERIDTFMSKKPPLVIITRDFEIDRPMLSASQKYDVPLYRTMDTTSAFSSALNGYLSVELAPRITRHGVLVEVYGEGILLLGESGVGKSETAIELIKRGHRLIADDAVEIRKVSTKTLVGSAPENIRHFIEVRGIGIINARRIFGMGAIKNTEKIDMIINLEPWDSTKVYDRMGLESETTEILGISVTSTTIPIKPGRNLAIIIEVAAMNNRQKKMGYNPAQELLNKLGMQDVINPPAANIDDWETI